MITATKLQKGADMTEIRVPKPGPHKTDPNPFTADEPMSDKILEAAHEIASQRAYGGEKDWTFDEYAHSIADILRKHFQ